MKNILKRLTAALICVVMLAGIVLMAPPTTVEAANHGQYDTLAMIYDLGSCPSMQGLALCGDYFYAIKTDGNDYAAAVCRVHKDSGSKTWLTNSGNSSNYFYDFGHGNDFDVVVAGGVTTMIVATSTSGSNSLVRYSISGTTATKVCGYTMTYNGSNLSGGAIRATRVDDENIYLLFRSGKKIYTGTLPISQSGGTLEMSLLCTLDYSTAYVNGVATDTSAWSLQGIGYYDHMLYLPLSSHTTSNMNMSIVLVYDLEGASGTIKPLDDPTFKITSFSYSALFEMESCLIDPETGLLYFNTNRRVTSSNTNHDGIHYITNWVYEPDQRTTEVNNYRWEMIDDELVSVTDGGAVYNGLAWHQGSVSGGTITDGRYATSKTVVLEHDRPWVMEWKSSGCTSGELLFATQAVSNYSGAPYIFVNGKNARVSIGAYDGSQYNNYSVTLADHGIDGSGTHVFRLTNKIASDGSNMVYLSVDGKELGAMNNYHIASASQGTTSNWVSGQDFRFSYLGTTGHKVNDSIEYIQVWGDGLEDQIDEPDIYRWEDQGSGLTSVSGSGLTANALTTTRGSYSDGIYTSTQMELNDEIVLLHDRSWSIEWQSDGSWSGGALLFASDHMSKTYQSPYIFRNSGSVLAIGAHDGTNYRHYGVKLTDYGITNADSHIYRLTNRINSDGSNMVYLYVDGEEIAPMNTYFVGGTSQGTTSDWLSGKDFTFGYMGTYQHPINSAGMDYIQVWENCSHSFGGWTTVNATCTAEGTKTRTCSLCGEVETETIPVIVHTWTDGTCQTCGTSCNHVYADDFCTVCGMKEVKTYYLVGYINNSDYGCESDHENLGQYKFVDGSLTATFESDSYVFVKTGDNNNWYMAQSYITSTTGTFYNTNTGSSEKMYVPGGVEVTFTLTENSDGSLTLSYVTASLKCDHSYAAQVTTPAGCLSEGVITYTCSKCGDSYTEAIRAAGHDYEITVVAPTCENNGYTIHACKNCDYSYNSDPVNPTGHDYSAVVTAPTCTEGGYTTYTCSKCGDSYTWNATPATGHSYSGGVCTVCGDTDSEYAPDYYLFGYINGANYACEEDAANLGEYKFENGKLTATFTENSYVAVKTGDNVNWYMTNGWQGEVTSVTLYNTAITGENSNKLFVPGGVEITFTLVVNADGTLSLSYVSESKDSKDIKWQVTSGSNADSASTNLRLVSWVSDVDDYESVTFNVTINGSTVPLVCTTAYTAIKASGLSISNPAGIFGEESANYFVTHTIMGIPAALFDSEILVTVTWTDLEGNSVTSDLETIVISSDWA